MYIYNKYVYIYNKYVYIYIYSIYLHGPATSGAGGIAKPCIAPPLLNRCAVPIHIINM